MIEAEDTTFSLQFHPRLTVISGVGPLEREGLTTELIGSLSSSRPGVHAEIMADTGSHLAIFRPHGARHRVIDIDAATDVSDRFANNDGSIDLLAVAGLDPRTAKRKIHLTASDLSTSTKHQQNISQLAVHNPAELWEAVDRVTKAQSAIDKAAEAAGTAPEDIAVVEQIEKRHRKFESAQTSAERSRRASFFAGAFAALAAFPSAILLDRTIAMGLVIVAALVTAVSFIQNQRMIKARHFEDEALAKAGVATYLGFHLQRVNGLLDNGGARHQLAKASAELEEAQTAWDEIAGDVSADWAVEFKNDIQRAAEPPKATEVTSTTTYGESSTVTDSTTLTGAILDRLAAVRSIGPAGESLPLILDDALNGLDWEAKAPLLELLVRSSESQQIVFMTQDADVTEWARLEAMTGAVSILEPSPDQGRSTINHQTIATG